MMILMKIFSFTTFGLCTLLFVSVLSAAEPAADGSAALRAALRDKTQQLLIAQSDLQTLQSGQAAIADEKKALAEKFEALKKQCDADRLKSDKSTASLTAQLEKQKLQNAQLSEAFDKAKAEGEKAAQAAHFAETQGATLAKENIVLQRSIADREAKNLSLFLIANEILTRYEEFSLGNALLAKEPFVGLTRTKLENLVQDYQDKILEQRTKP
jgi:chromosome segregation ATPase